MIIDHAEHAKQQQKKYREGESRKKYKCAFKNGKKKKDLHSFASLVIK